MLWFESLQIHQTVCVSQITAFRSQLSLCILFSVLPRTMWIFDLESVQTQQQRGEWSWPGMDPESSGDKKKQNRGRPRKKYLDTCRDAHQDYASYRKAMQKLYESNWTLAVDKKIQSIFHSISDRLTIYFSFFMFILEGPPTVMTLCQQVVKSELRHKKETRIQDFSCRGACNTWEVAQIRWDAWETTWW
jgi:hypothetical protein